VNFIKSSTWRWYCFVSCYEYNS